MIAAAANEYFPALSPDGKALAYTSDEPGRAEVFLQPYPVTGRVLKVSLDGGEEPLWSADGRELFFRNGQRWMVVSVRTTPAIETSAPQLLFEGPFVNVPGLSYAVDSERKRFLMIQEAAAANPREIRLIFNWFREWAR